LTTTGEEPLANTLFGELAIVRLVGTKTTL
jgi:hypothetical protein